MSQSMLAIKTKLGSSSNSLRDYSAARGLTEPDSMLEFDTWLNSVSPPPPPPPTYYLFNLKYHSSDAYTACNVIGTNPFYSTCNSLTNGCTLLNDAYGYASNGYYSNGSTVYYVEGNGYINTTSACTAPPPPPPPPPTTYYYDYVRCTGVNAYNLPIYTISVTGDMPAGGITIAGQCFSALDGIPYTGIANYPVRAYTATGCACE